MSTSIPYQNASLSPDWYISDTSLPPNVQIKAIECGPGAWAPAALMGELDGVGHPGLELEIIVIWRLNQQMQYAFLLAFYLSDQQQALNKSPTCCLHCWLSVRVLVLLLIYPDQINSLMMAGVFGSLYLMGDLDGGPGSWFLPDPAWPFWRFWPFVGLIGS